MGMRFRRSIRIAPGIRLNLTTSGLSTTIGPRGASINIGRRGTYLNTGIPGTGLSFREKLSSQPSPRTREARVSYRDLQIASRASQKAAARLHAQAEHDEHEARLASFSSVLANRNRNFYDWNDVWRSRGSYRAKPLPPIAHQDFEEISRAAAAKSLPMVRWMVLIAVLCLPAIIWGNNFYRGLISIAIVATIFWIVKVRSQRLAFCETYSRSLEEKARIERAKVEADYCTKIARDKQSWDDEEARLSRNRMALQQADLEALTYVLEEELNNEVFPVPLVLELELASVSEARIEFVLPELTDIPELRTQLTKTGKLSTRKMAQRDRVALYTDLCCGIALRLVYETLRVLGSIENLEVFGTANLIDASTGHDEEVVALHVATTREAFGKLNLDFIDPSTALAGLGGTFACNRKGEVAPIAGVVGLS